MAWIRLNALRRVRSDENVLATVDNFTTCHCILTAFHLFCPLREKRKSTLVLITVVYEIFFQKFFYLPGVDVFDLCLARFGLPLVVRF